jgi:hypothetical protein
MDISVRGEHRGSAQESASRQSKTADGFHRLDAAPTRRDIEEPDWLTHALDRDPAQILELEVPLDEPRRVLRRPPADRQRRAAAAAEFLADLNRGAAGGPPMANLMPHCVQKRRSDRLSWRRSGQRIGSQGTVPSIIPSPA